MTEEQFVWDHFKFNAEQRLKSFNFFVLLSIFADGGVLTALEKSFDPKLQILLGAFIVILAVVFWLVDTRSQNLLKLTITALKEIKQKFPQHSQLFKLDSDQQSNFVRYTFAFRTLQICQMFLGGGVLIYGFMLWQC